jgi:hypothetical protein
VLTCLLGNPTRGRETEAEENTTTKGIGKLEALSGIQKACLEFCIALLSQSITRKEYDSPLVCALAVLGIKEDGWKGAEQYPPILSAVIKVARFIVVQQALELSEPFNDDEFNIDGAGTDLVPARARVCALPSPLTCPRTDALSASRPEAVRCSPKSTHALATSRPRGRQQPG